jgi:mutator protein MutT
VTVAVVAGVIVRDGRLLVCERPAGRPHPGKWEFPGGKIEAGESAGTGLCRELREELGIDADAGATLWRTRHRDPDRGIFELEFLHVAAFTGEIDGRHFAALRWLAPGELLAIDLLEGDREFAAALARGDVRPEETRVIRRTRARTRPLLESELRRRAAGRPPRSGR